MALMDWRSWLVETINGATQVHPGGTSGVQYGFAFPTGQPSLQALARWHQLLFSDITAPKPEDLSSEALIPQWNNKTNHTCLIALAAMGLSAPELCLCIVQYAFEYMSCSDS